jgi:hypothetical protein
MLMQLAQPLTCEDRISMSSASTGSRLPAMAKEARCHSFISEGAAARRSSLTVMVGSFHWFRPQDERGLAWCDIAAENFGRRATYPDRRKITAIATADFRQ